MDKMPKENKQEIIEGVVDSPKVQELIPAMNVNVPQKKEEEEKCIISDQQLMGIYGEILEQVRKDREEVDSVLGNFVNMVINEGDSSSSSKEALVSLLKIKTDQSDKMAKVADLMTRVKLKERDTFPKYLAANQNNTINIGDGGSKRALLDAIQKAKQGKKE